MESIKRTPDAKEDNSKIVGNNLPQRLLLGQ
jgi:hypothetical protein